MQGNEFQKLAKGMVFLYAYSIHDPAAFEMAARIAGSAGRISMLVAQYYRAKVALGNANGGVMFSIGDEDALRHAIGELFFYGAKLAEHWGWDIESIMMDTLTRFQEVTVVKGKIP